MVPKGCSGCSINIPARKEEEREGEGHFLEVARTEPQNRVRNVAFILGGQNWGGGPTTTEEVGMNIGGDRSLSHGLLKWRL